MSLRGLSRGVSVGRGRKENNSCVYTMVWISSQRVYRTMYVPLADVSNGYVPKRQSHAIKFGMCKLNDTCTNEVYSFVAVN